MTFRCDKKFLASDGTFDLNIVKNYKVKFKSNSIYENFNEYIKSQKEFNKKTGWFTKKGCKEYLEYVKPRIRTNTNNQMRTKYSSEITNCKLHLNNMHAYKKAYINSLSDEIKLKIINKLKKTLKNPNDKRINRFSCYMKMLIDLSNSTDYVGRNRISINNIIDKFVSEYKPKEYLKICGSKDYISYLLTTKATSETDLKYYKEWYKNDSLFIKAMETVLNTYMKTY